MKITINNEEVLCDKDFTINEEMLNTSSTILNNVYPIEWEQDKDYTSRFYYPKDYSKCKIFDEIYHPEEKEEVEGTSFSINVDTTKEYSVQTLKGQTSQSGTPTPDNPVPINITTGRQVVSVRGKNLVNIDGIYSSSGSSFIRTWEDGVATLTWTSGFNFYLTSDGQTTFTFDPNETYTFSFDHNGNALHLRTDEGNTNRFSTNTDTEYTRYSYTFTGISSLVLKFVRKDNSGTAYLKNFQIEKGNQATTYEEYNGNDYEINLGKNLLNTLYQHNVGDVVTSNGVTYTFNADGSITINGTATGTSYVLLYGSSLNDYQTQRFIVNGNYKVGNWNNNNIYLMCRDTSATYKAIYKGNNYGGSDIKNISGLPLGVIYIQVSGTVNNTTIYPQIEEGNQVTSYSQYKTPIYLGKIGTYQDYIFKNTNENPLYDSNLEEGQWYIHKEIGRVVLNGSESWGDGGVNYVFYTTSITDYAISNNIPISNYYNGVNNVVGAGGMSTQPNNSIGFINKDGATTPRFYIKDERYDHTQPSQLKTWLSTHNTEVYYVLNTPTNTLIEDEELINQLNAIELLEGLNNVSVSSPYLPFIMSLMYNYQEGYTEEDMLFCGIVKNTGEISLNPRYPHYCNIQVLDFKDFLSQGETLDFVISDKTIGEAIEQVIGTIAPYGFVLGELELSSKDNLIGAYSTKDKTAYDVFNYLADITQSRWTTRMIDENTVAIDFYDTDKLPVGTQIEYDQTWFKNHKIDDLSYSYSSNDYRNKQVMLSGEVYSNIETTETMVADGYKTQFNTIDKLGKVSSVLQDGAVKTIITKEEYDLGYEGDFIYQPGNTYFESTTLLTSGTVLTITYFAIIEGREIVLNQAEIQRVADMTGRKGIIARYENRNDATTTSELQAIGQSYLKYKGIPEIKLNVFSRENTWNIGDRVYFNAPLEELTQEYMVKSKKIQRITTIDELFYEYELTSSFNMEQDINYFDNQRYKNNGNIGEGEFISRNIDIENTANVIFYDLEVNEVELGDNTLQSELQTTLGVE